jgi:hypothetical protein
MVTQRGPGLDTPGAPTVTTKSNSGHSTSPWWAKPPHCISAEELDRVAGAVRRGAGVLETAVTLVREVAA